MRLLIYSDLHCEHGSFHPKKAWLDDADAVIQTGDLNLGEKPLTWLNGLNKPCLYVTGNHEYWLPVLRSEYANSGSRFNPYSRDGEWHFVLREDHTMDSLDGRLRALTAGTQVHTLQHSSVILNGVRFLGTTLWTDLGDLPDAYTSRMMNDFVRIQTAPGVKFIPADWRRLHTEAVTWLTQELARPFDGKTVVITHHAPSLKSFELSKWTEEPYEPFYTSALDHLVEQADVWVHGHLHAFLDYRIGKCRVVCNARGAPFDKSRRNFRKNFVIGL